MRSRKIVLLIDDDDMRRNVTAFVLENTGRYTVLACTQDELPYGHLAIVRIDRAEDLCRRLKKSNPEMAVLLIGGEPQARTGALIDGWLCSDDAQNMRSLLERVRIVCARRRGPKKKPSLTYAEFRSVFEGPFWHEHNTLITRPVTPRKPLIVQSTWEEVGRPGDRICQP